MISTVSDTVKSRSDVTVPGPFGISALWPSSIRKCPVSYREFLARALVDPKTAPLHLEDKCQILTHTLNANPKAEGVAIYLGAHTDVAHAVVIPARTYLLIDPEYANIEVRNEVIARISSYSGDRKVDVHQNGDRWVAHTSDGTSFVLIARSFEQFNDYPYRITGFILKKPNGTLLGHAARLLESASKILQPNGHILYSDLEDHLQQNSRGIESFGLRPVVHGQLSCCRVFDGGDYQSYPFVLWSQPSV